MLGLSLFNSVHAIELINSNTKENSCPGADVDEIIYISGNSETRFAYDSFRFSTTKRAISNASTVTLWQSDQSLVSGCASSDSWRQQSTLTPGGNKDVVAFGANCTFNKPTDNTKRNLQFVYNVRHAAVGNSGDIPLPSPYEFTYFETTNDIRNDNQNVFTINNGFLSDIKVHDNECQNFELRYCGDGLITNGETCDPAAPGFNETTCNVNTCTPIELPTPQIRVDKTDENPNDLDANEDDSQTVNFGDAAVFKITVTNTGTEDLKQVTLDDPRAASCDRSISQTNTLISQIGNRDTVFNIGESFTYICERGNSESNYVNTISVSGVGVESGRTVNDSDPTNVFVLPQPSTYDLALRKTLSSTTPGPFVPGDTVSFDIRVFNQGDVVANNIEVTDYIPTGLTLNDSAWNLSGDSATRVISSISVGSSVNLTITFTIDAGVSGSIVNFAEISRDDGDDCDSTPDNNDANDGTPVDNSIGTGCNPGGDEDDHDPETIVVMDPVFDLALRKILSSTTPGPFAVGGTVTFDIQVINQGAVNASDIEVTDYIPAGLTLNDSAWTLSGDSATRVIPSILEGTTETVSITFTIDADAAGSITNFAEISEDNNDDCDSVADDTNGNQPGENDGTQIDNNIGTGCDEGGDEDDSDPETITIGESNVVLTKELKDGQASIVDPGDRVDYIITVKNISDTVATNLIVEDSFPEELTLADSGWTLDTSRTRVAVYNTQIASLAAGAEVEIEISFTVNDGAEGTILNLAIVCDADDVDGECDEPEVCDPTTDDCCEESDENGDADGCEPITVRGPSIMIDKIDANTVALDQDTVI